MKVLLDHMFFYLFRIAEREIKSLKKRERWKNKEGDDDLLNAEGEGTRNMLTIIAMHFMTCICKMKIWFK